MSAPTSYTEDELATYMVNITGDAATALGISVLDFGAEPVDEALVRYGVSDIASATDIKKLRALARIAAWEYLAANSAGKYNFSADGGSYSRGSLHNHCVINLNHALADALPYMTEYYVEVVDVDHKNDPYEYYEADDRLELR